MNKQILRLADSINRRSFVGGSDARIIMGVDEAALIRLWREKRGEAEPEDLSGNLIVQLGAATEELNRPGTSATPAGASLTSSAKGQRRHGMDGERPVPLESEQSAALREKLLTELGTITSADLAAIWVQEALTAKNSLTAADAKLVEDAFEHRLSELAPSQSAEATDDAAPSTHVVAANATRERGNSDVDQPDGINKNALVLATPRRYRNREHLRFVAQQPCLICGRNNPIRITFVTCNHGRSVAKRATNSPSRSVARITALFIAPATSRPGGRRPALTPSRSPVSSGNKPDSMIRKILTSRVSRRARRLDQLPRPLRVRGSRGPIRLP